MEKQLENFNSENWTKNGKKQQIEKESAKKPNYKHSTFWICWNYFCCYSAAAADIDDERIDCVYRVHMQTRNHQTH